MRAQGPINCSAIDLWRCINYNKERNQWDTTAEDTFFMSKIGTNGYTIYTRSKKVMFVEGREFLLDFLTNEEPDGLIYIIISSNPNLYGLIQQKKGVTRAESPIGGWILTPDKSDP